MTFLTQFLYAIFLLLSTSVLVTIISTALNLDCHIRRLYAVILVHTARFVFNTKTKQGDSALISLWHGGNQAYKKKYPNFYNEFENGISSLGTLRVFSRETSESQSSPVKSKNSRGRDRSDSTASSNSCSNANDSEKLSTFHINNYSDQNQNTLVPQAHHLPDLMSQEDNFTSLSIRSLSEMESDLLLRKHTRARHLSINQSESEHSEYVHESSTLQHDKSAKICDITKELISESKICINAILDDNVTKRFQAQHLLNWNLLSRAESNLFGSDSKSKDVKIEAAYYLGFFIRYFILFPYRITLITVSIMFLGIMSLFFNLGGLYLIRLPMSLFLNLRNITDRQVTQQCNLFCMRLIMRGLGMIINFHHDENIPTDGSICVANHTTVLDMIVLMTNRTYSTIGQRHGGIIGFVQKSLDALTSNIWFDRADSNARHQVSSLMQEHVKAEPKKDPIMIFPEGTCINNTSVMRFNKGCFEIDTTIYPVAIKYNAFFGDAFWDSSKYSMGHYVFKIITAWCIVCDVFYLPPTKKEKKPVDHHQTGTALEDFLLVSESALELAQRCQTDIAKKISLDNLSNWDGGLKRKLLAGKAKDQGVTTKQEKISKKFSSKLQTTREDVFSDEEDNFSENSEPVCSSYSASGNCEEETEPEPETLETLVKSANPTEIRSQKSSGKNDEGYNSIKADRKTETESLDSDDYSGSNFDEYDTQELLDVSVDNVVDESS